MKRFGLILFILVIVYFIFIIRQDIIDSLDFKKEEARLVKNVAREEQRTAEMGRDLGHLGDQSYLEELARKKLQMIKRGETAYKVIGR